MLNPQGPRKPTVMAALLPIRAGKVARFADTVCPPRPPSVVDLGGGFRKSNLKSESCERMEMRSTALGATMRD